MKNTKKDFCFVIMPFAEEMQSVYDDIIRPLVEETGLKCVRADELSGSNNILRTIIRSIFEATVVIADLTGKNANVFYELGIAHALGNNTIIISQDPLPFDVSNYKSIMYQNTISGGRKLQTELKSFITTIEEWSAIPSNPVQDFLPASAKKTISTEEFEKLKEEFEYNKKMLEEAQQQLKKHEVDIIKVDNYYNIEAELERLKEALRLLFPPEFRPEGTDAVEVMERILEEVEENGTYSVEIAPPGEGHKKLIFTKVK